MDIRVYDIQNGIKTLGPGIRFVLWTQGCLRNCYGCMTPNSQPLNGGYLLSVSDLANRLINSGRTELTISGGEPFLQAKALTQLIVDVRKKIDLGVMIYTGYTIEELRNSNDPDFHQLLSVCDLLVDGAYIDELNDGMNLRGSSNQRAIPLTNRYLDTVAEFGTKPAEVEFFFSEEKLSMVGIPSRDMLQRIKEIQF